MNTKEHMSGYTVAVLLLLVVAVIVLYYFVVVFVYGSFSDYFSFGLKVMKFVGLAALGLVGSGAIILLGLFLLSRHRAIRVFLPHHHQDEQLATTLRDALLKVGIESEILLVQPRDHDEVVSLVREKLQDSLAVIAIPPQIKEAFADAEILAASVILKPMMFVIDDKARQLPRTALRGYPVFRFDEMERRGFVPIKTFLNYLFRHHDEVLQSFGRAVLSMSKAWEVAFLLFCIVLVLAGVTVFFDLDLAFRTYQWTFGAAVLVWALMIIVGLTLVVRSRARATRIVRQKATAGELTYDTLSSVLGHLQADREVLDCLEKEPLQGLSGH